MHSGCAECQRAAVGTAGYDEEARYFEAGVRGDKRAGLLSALQEAVWPLYETQLTALRARTLTEFKKALRAALAEGGEGFSAAAARCGRPGAWLGLGHSLGVTCGLIWCQNDDPRW